MNQGTDYQINPLSGDYAGGSVDDLSNAVYLRITTPLGSRFDDPTFGSKLHLLQRTKEVSSVKLLAQQYTEQALQPLIDSKRADHLNITVDDPVNGRLFLQCEVYQDGELVTHFSRHIQVMQG